MIKILIKLSKKWNWLADWLSQLTREYLNQSYIEATPLSTEQASQIALAKIVKCEKLGIDTGSKVYKRPSTEGVKI